MKILYFNILLMIIIVLPLLSAAQDNAPIHHETEQSNIFFSVKWEVNHISNSLVKNTSGWGMSFEANHFFTKNLSAGVFVAWHTNNDYKGNKTYIDNNQSINISMQHSIFQVPFGGLIRYDCRPNKKLSPYAQIKIGANYSKQSAYLQMVELYDKNWGIYLSPEIGISVFPTKNNKFGLQASTYYAFASNKANFMNIYKVNNLNNWGLRIGLTIQI